MCGFSGIFSDKDISSQAIENSLKSIIHRGPDDSLIANFKNKFSIFSTEFSSNTAKEKYPNIQNNYGKNWIGFNRLSIVDRKFGGMQPFYNADRNIAFMMVGEVYNYQELQHKFLKNRIDFVSSTDSEVVFNLFLTLGESFIYLLEGMFSIVVVDYNNNEIKIWRDHLGQKPFYYFIDKDLFIFSSEIKGIFATKLVEKKIEAKNLAYSFYLGTCPNPLTIYQNIFSVKPGCCLTVDLNNFSLQENHFWQLNYADSSRIITNEEFNIDLHNTIKQHLIGDVDKGLMLSGGLDSGLLCHHLGKMNANVKAFSIYAENNEIDESQIAQISAEKANLIFEKIKVPDSFSIKDVEEFMCFEEDPNENMEPSYFLTKYTKNIGIRVLYNATGLDEIFGGYSYYGDIAKFSAIKKLAFVGKFVKSLPKLSKLHWLNEFGLEYLPTMSREKQDWNNILKLFKSNDKKNWEHPFIYVKNQILEKYPEYKYLPILKKISYWDLFYYISSHHTYRNDIAGMKNSTEIRFPFLEHNFVQKYFNYSPIFEGIELANKPFIRNYAKDILPQEVLSMKKKGFGMPKRQDEYTKFTKEIVNNIIETYINSQIFDIQMLQKSIEQKKYKQKWELASVFYLI